LSRQNQEGAHRVGGGVTGVGTDRRGKR
jgi:hypothetical protein